MGLRNLKNEHQQLFLSLDFVGILISVTKWDTWLPIFTPYDRNGCTNA